MRLKIALAALTLALLACTAVGAPLPPPTDTPVPPAPNTPTPESIPAPIISSPAVTSLHMFSELDGWGVAENAIIRTTDGGEAWHNVSPAGITEFGFGVGTAFLNASQAWVLAADAADPRGAGVMYRTSDGGLTWTSNPVPFGGGDLTFLNENDGWLMLGLGVAAGSMGVAVFKTSDGGTTWAQVFTNDPTLPESNDSLPLGGIKACLTPLDAQTAWIGGVIYAPGSPYFFKTTDGGQSWEPQNLPLQPGMENSEIAIESGPMFTSQTEGILPVRVAGETYQTAFYATQNGGQSWEFLSMQPGAGDVDFVSATEGIFWTGGFFFITPDGGHTWSAIQPDILFSDSLRGLDFVNARTGWVWVYEHTGSRYIYKTADGGSTWFPIGE